MTPFKKKQEDRKLSRDYQSLLDENIRLRRILSKYGNKDNWGVPLDVSTPHDSEELHNLFNPVYLNTRLRSGGWKLAEEALR